MSTWEERMSARAAAKREAAEAERRQLEEENDPHRDHHVHLAGTAVVCSCGEFRGLACVAFPPELADATEAEARNYWESLTCGTCGARGVTEVGG